MGAPVAIVADGLGTSTQENVYGNNSTINNTAKGQLIYQRNTGVNPASYVNYADGGLFGGRTGYDGVGYVRGYTVSDFETNADNSSQRFFETTKPLRVESPVSHSGREITSLFIAMK